MGKNAGKGAAERLKPRYCLTSLSAGSTKNLRKGQWNASNCRSTAPKNKFQHSCEHSSFETSAYVFLRSPRHVRTSNKNYAPQEIHRNELQTLELASPAATCSQHQNTVAAKDLATTFLLGRAPPAVCWGRRITVSHLIQFFPDYYPILYPILSGYIIICLFWERFFRDDLTEVK